MRYRWFVWGMVAVVLYLATAFLILQHVPVRLLYDGEGPPPYHWVRPPANLPGPNEPHEPEGGSVVLTPAGSQFASISTGDVQASIIFLKDSIASRAGESSAQIRMTPLDPVTVAPPPQGVRFDGNAYRIEAIYVASRHPIILRQPVTVILRYPIYATEMLRSSGWGWITLPTMRVEAALQVFASTDQLGVFVAAAPGTAGLRSFWWGYIFAAVGLIVWLIAAVLIGLRTAS
jgi:hypothetical protein